MTKKKVQKKYASKANPIEQCQDKRFSEDTVLYLESLEEV
jgi:hypothetical protein